MFCASCGTSISAEGVFCHNCGARAPAKDPAGSTPVYQAPAAEQEPYHPDSPIPTSAAPSATAPAPYPSAAAPVYATSAHGPASVSPIRAAVAAVAFVASTLVIVGTFADWLGIVGDYGSRGFNGFDYGYITGLGDADGKDGIITIILGLGIGLLGVLQLRSTARTIPALLLAAGLLAVAVGAFNTVELGGRP